MDDSPRSVTDHFMTVTSPLPPSVPYNSVPLFAGNEYVVALSCAINPTKELIACGTEAGILLIYRSFSLQLVRSLKVIDEAIYKLFWSPDSQSILVITMGSIIWLSLNRDSSITRIIEGKPVCIPGQVFEGGSNEYRNMQGLPEIPMKDKPTGDVLAIWTLKDQELSLLSYSISSWLVEVKRSQFHRVPFGQEQFHYGACFRVIGVELLVIVASNYYEAVGLRSIVFLHQTRQSMAKNLDFWGQAFETNYTPDLVAAFGTETIPSTMDVLAITGYTFVVSTGLKYAIFRRDTLFAPYTYAGMKEYTKQMLRDEIGYTGALTERRFEMHKQTMHTNEEPTIAVTFLNGEGTELEAQQLQDIASRLRGNFYMQINQDKLYTTTFRSFHHFFLFLYAYHASLYKAKLSCGKTRFYEVLTDFKFPVLCESVAAAAARGSTLDELIAILSFNFSADICDFSSIICDNLIVCFTLVEAEEKSTKEKSSIAIYITGTFNLIDVLRAFENDLTKRSPDFCFLYPNPGLAELTLNYLTISFITSIDKQWLYIANSRFIITLSITYNVCELYEYSEHFLINDLVFDVRPLSAVQVEFGYPPYEIIMASVGYFPPYTADNLQFLAANMSKSTTKRINTFYGKLRELASVEKKPVSAETPRRIRPPAQKPSRRKGSRWKPDITNNMEMLQTKPSMKFKTVSKRGPASSKSTMPVLADEQDLSETTTSSLTNTSDPCMSEGNIILDNSQIDYLQRLLLQVEPQLMFWACKEIQDFNSCFPGFETISTNILYIEREDELDIDPSPLYPPTALPRAIDVDYHELQYPTRDIGDDEINLLSLENEVSPYHYLCSYRKVHDLPVHFNVMF